MLTLVLVLGVCGSTLPFRTPRGAYIEAAWRGATYRQASKDQDAGQGFGRESFVTRAHGREHHQSAEVSCDAVQLWYQIFGWTNYTADGVCTLLFKTLRSLKAKYILMPAQAGPATALLGRSRGRVTGLSTLQREDVALTR
jgi:hypothetical protein